MIKVLKVQNVKCGACASTLTKSLLEEFGEVTVNLEVTPREITLDIQENRQFIRKEVTVKSKINS